MESDDLFQLARDLVEKYRSNHFAIGAQVRHPDGRMVRITGGQYWGTYGVSNHWYWREIQADGSLGPEESGYGW